ncbi:hypothetical protein RP726_13080 [Candidatus Methylospira mobilis]|uniref:hypothetical protein n=1 Tax=Candidatus Methylospira mobilis TaxID=1808979 RepID=UPI0028E3C558|nr:hypothetical protein [Candidatus Methylospira mobilis]WNV03387.1 hypothetical protein RP726_13080 [Candidatus Methylospira mobilis]
MTGDELNSALHRLNLEPKEAVQFLGVNQRTFRRWLDHSQEIPGPAECAINAWIRMDDFGLAWRPDSVAIRTGNLQSIAAYNDYALELTEIITRATNRGGPASPWVVDMEKRCATLQNGSFSPSW